VSGVRCQVSGVRCQVSGVRCQVSGVRCQVSGLTPDSQKSRDFLKITYIRLLLLLVPALVHACL